MLNFDGDFDGDVHVDVTCKQTLDFPLNDLRPQSRTDFQSTHLFFFSRAVIFKVTNDL